MLASHGRSRIARRGAVAALLLLASVFVAGAAVADTTPMFQKGEDFATAEDVGWVRGFSLGENATSFELTLVGLPGGSVTIDDLVTATRNGSSQLQVNVTDPLEGNASVHLRLWNGTTPPTADGGTQVCSVVDTSQSGAANGTCEGLTLRFQYIVAVPDDGEDPSDFAFRLEEIDGTETGDDGSDEGGSDDGGSSGGGGTVVRSPPSESSSTATSSTPLEGASHRYVSQPKVLGAGGQLDIRFPSDEPRLDRLRVVVEEPCRYLRTVADRYPGVPAGEQAPPVDRVLDSVDLAVECWGEPTPVRSVTWNLTVDPEKLSPHVEPRQLHAMHRGSWLLGGSVQEATGEEVLPLTVPLTDPTLVAVVEDETPPRIGFSVPGTGEEASSVEVEAMDGVGVAELVVTVDGEPFATVDQAPFTVAVTAADVGPGPIQVEAEAVDVSGLRTEASRNATLVPDTTAPAIELDLLGPGEDGGLLAEAQASDDVGVERVTFKLDGEPFATVEDPPYEALADASRLDAGQHTVEVTAVDAAGNEGTASARFDVAETDETENEDEDRARGIGLGGALAAAALALAASALHPRRRRG